MMVKERRCGPEGHARRVHRDVLGLLLEQGVEQEGVLELHPLGLAGGLDALGLAFRHGVGVEEEAADQGGLAVVDVADDDQEEVIGGGLRGGGHGRAGRVRGTGGLRRRERGRSFREGRSSCDHMNPLARSFCIALRSWWSWARPARSETRVTFSSSMISAIVAASLSTGLVIGMQPSER